MGNQRTPPRRPKLQYESFAKTRRARQIRFLYEQAWHKGSVENLNNLYERVRNETNNQYVLTHHPRTDYLQNEFKTMEFDIDGDVYIITFDVTFGDRTNPYPIDIYLTGSGNSSARFDADVDLEQPTAEEEAAWLQAWNGPPGDNEVTD